MSSESPQSATILDDVGAALARHAGVVVLVVLASVLAAYAALQFVSEQYESSAQLLVKLGRENTELPVTVEKGGLLTTGVRKEEINSEIQLLQSRDLIDATLAEIGVDAFAFLPAAPTTWFEAMKYRIRMFVRDVRRRVDELLILANLRKRLTPRESALLLLERSIRVEREKDSDVITVSVRLPDPGLAMRAADVLVRQYLERRLEVRRDPSVTTFYEQQVDEFRHRLSRIGSTRQAVQGKRGIASVADQRALLLRRLRTLEDEIVDLERERKVIAGRAARAVLAAGPAAGSAGLQPGGPALSSYPSLDLLKKRVTELRIKQNEMLQRYKSGAVAVTDVDEELHEVETLMLRSVESLLAEKRPEVNLLRTQLEQLNIGERELDTVEQERQAAVQSFLVYAKRLEEARISAELDLRRVSNIAVLSSPERPIQPVYPPKLLIVGASIPVGLVLGIGLALLLEYLNRRIRSPLELVRRGDVAYLGTMAVPKRSRRASA
jgi:uncharacterized protein involved in exopolysaccharide biosynthesis